MESITKTKAYTIGMRTRNGHRQADLLAVGGALILGAVPACGTREHRGTLPRTDRRSALHSPIGFFDAD